MSPNRRAGGARRQTTKEDDAMRRASAALILLLLLFVTATPVVAAEGQLTWAVHISLAPTWFDPAETPGIVTPFMILYALHEKVGDDGFKKAPVGTGPYRFVSFTPGIELVMEAFDQYWRRSPSVKRLVFKSVPEESTRLAMLKRGEADIVYSIRGALAEELQRTPGLTLKPTIIHGAQWLNFVDQWDPKSPWADKRVRMAANYAIDRKAINQAETLGFSRITASIVPHSFEFAWQPPLWPYDPAKAKKLLV